VTRAEGCATDLARQSPLGRHDATLAAVSRAPPAKLQAYKRRMGWSFPRGRGAWRDPGGVVMDVNALFGLSALMSLVASIVAATLYV
jgi:Bacterial protein of unknown function (DUF899)